MTTAQVDFSQPTLATPTRQSGPSGSNIAQFRKEGPGWFAIFNLNTCSPNGQPGRTLDIDLVNSVRLDSVICCVRFSPDGNYLAAGGNHTTRVYDVASGEIVCDFVDVSVSRSEDHYIRSVYFSPDGRYLATGAEDGNVRIWSVLTRTLYKLLSGHTSEVYALEYSSDGRLLVSSSGDHTVRVWGMDDLHNEEMIQGQQHVFVINGPDVLRQTNQGIAAIAISPNSKLIAAAFLDNCIRIWDVDSRMLVAELEGHSESVYSVAFGWDGRQLFSGSLDCTVKRWDISPLYHPQEQRVEPCLNTYTYSGHEDYILSVALTHDNSHHQWIISSSKDRSVKFWDIPQTDGASRPEFTLKAHINSVISVDASPAGGMFATGGGDWELKLWRYTTLQ